MNRSESIVEIAKAMSQFQNEVEQPAKTKENPYLKTSYVPLENVVNAINKVAPKKGLSFTQWPLIEAQGKVGVATLLMHQSGEFIEYDPMYMQVDKPSPQSYGAVITYIKRYSLSAIFGITSDEDDDGNLASESSQQSGKQGKQASNEITQDQVGQVKTKVTQFAQARNQTNKAVLDALKINDVTQLSNQQAENTIKQLDFWLESAKKKADKQ